jgi:hypothetical protein
VKSIYFDQKEKKGYFSDEEYVKNKKIKRQNTSCSFNSGRLTLFLVSVPIFKFFDKRALNDELESRFQTVFANVTEYKDSQLMLAVIQAST